MLRAAVSLVHPARRPVDRRPTARVATCLPLSRSYPARVRHSCLHPALSGTILKLCWRCSNPWQDWADRFAQRGYSSLLLDLDASVASGATSSQARLGLLEQGKLAIQSPAARYSRLRLREGKSLYPISDRPPST